VRRGYIQGLNSKKDRPVGVQKLLNQGFGDEEIRKVFKFLWHNSKPKKQAIFMWQALNMGIITGEWLSWRVPNSQTGCVMCPHQMETIVHLL